MRQFTETQLDAIKELINIGVGRGASVLNTLLDSHIDLFVPFVNILSHQEMSSYLTTLGENQLSVVSLPFRGSITGSAKLIFPTTSATNLVSAFTGETMQEMDMDSIRVGTLSEIGNIVINSVMGSISNMLSIHFSYSIPVYQERQYIHLLDENESNAVILLAQTRFHIDKLEIIGNFIIFFEFDSFENLIEKVRFFIQNAS